MNNLEIQVVEGKLVTDSRVVAKMVDKEHKHLMRDIRNYVEILGKSNFGLSDFFIEHSYKSAQNKDLSCYLLTKKGCNMVANKLTGEKGILFTATYVTRFEEMEGQLKSQVALHSYMIEDPVKRAEKWIEEYKEKELLMLKVEEQQPLVTFAEKCIKTNDSILIREMSKIITEQGIVNIGEKKLYQKLREWGLILKGKTEPSQRAMNSGYFEVTQRVIKTPYGERLESTTKVLPKGQVYIVERLDKEVNQAN